MDLIVSLSAIILVILIGWITPGPNMFAVMAASLQHGRRHGLATGFGLALATLVWATLAVFGVAVMFDLFPRAVLALKLAGAAYLIWLGIKSVEEAITPSKDAGVAKNRSKSIHHSAFNGFLVSMGNPKAALFFGSVMTAFIPASGSDWYLGFVVLLCGVMSALLHSVTATVFSTELALAFFTRYQKRISLAFGALFIALGGGIVWAALRRA